SSASRPAGSERTLTRRRPVRIVGPWTSTTSPSAASRASDSSPVAPTSRARRKASRVFSGASARPPRWAKVIGGVTARHAGRRGVPSAAVARAESVVLLNTGHGKGKSSAAFGVMARGWARGWRVGLVQFVKGGKWKTGERKLADHLGIEWHTLGDGFTWESTDLDETAAKGRHAFEVARDKLSSGDYDLLVLDEITYAVKYGWVPEASVVMTGRDATPGLIDVADTVTEMRKVKHAYDEGIKALKGIEYCPSAPPGGLGVPPRGVQHDGGLLLGLDVGTTRIKAVVLDAAGGERAAAAVPTPFAVAAGGVEMDAADFEAALSSVVAAVGPDRERVAAVGVAGMAESGAPLAAGRPVAPVIAWYDGRGEETVAAL